MMVTIRRPARRHQPGTIARTIRAAGSHVLWIVVTTITGVLLARMLGPEARGVYAVITTTVTIATTAGHLSIVESQIALWSDPSRHRALIGNAVFLGLLLGAPVALVTLVVAASFVEPELLALSLITIPSGILANNLAGILLLQSRTGMANGAWLASVLIQCLSLAVLATTGLLTVTAVIACWAITASLPAVLYLCALRGSTPRWDLRLALRQLALSVRFHVGRVAFFMLQSVNVLLLNAFVSPVEVGLYTVAVMVLSVAQAPTEAVRQVCLARQAASDEQDASRVTARAIRINLLLASTIVGVLAILSTELIPLVYGKAYAPSVAPLLALAPGAVALALVRPAEQYLVRLARPLTMAAIPICGLALNLGLTVMLIPLWGVVGAGLSASAAYVFVALAESLWFVRVSRVAHRELLPRIADVRAILAGIRSR